MCGIFIAFNYGNGKFGGREFLKATEVVTHRGPDNLGHFDDGTCFLGHTRLSIIGLDAKGNQPFHFENLVMVFNGEIFNYIELRDELAGLGYSFETHSDTEVVIKAFHKWGGGCFSKFNGMWALVIYDQKKRALTASRDRFGQKPMFVMLEGGIVYFASEVHQLAPFSDGEIDFGLIQMFLKEGGYDGQGRTFFRSIEEFPKAQYCEIDAGNRCVSFRYWDYWGGKIQDVDDATFSEFSTLLQHAVKLRLRADVPFGVLLSGGVDSTIVSAYCAQFADTKVTIPAFTYSSNDAMDETRFAQAVADRLKLSLITRTQEVGPAQYRARLKQLVRHMGRGHSSPAIVSIDYLYESVAQSGIKVALDGQGADELLAGYKTYYPLSISSFLRRGWLKQAGYSLVDAYRFGIPEALMLYLRNVLPEKAKSLLRRLYGYERFFRTYPDFGKKKLFVKRIKSVRNRNVFNRYLILQHDLNLENLLFYGDIISMRHSVENRSPFLDHRLVDFVFQKSEKLKIWDGTDKYALRVLPVYREFKDVLDRKKIGFSSDIQKSTKSFMVEELKNSPILGWPIFSKALPTFIDAAGFDDPKYERFFFRLYQVHLWNEVFQNDGDSQNPPRAENNVYEPIGESE